jgi:CBS domain-containing protein
MTIAALIARRPAQSVITCDRRDSVRSVIALLADKRIGALPVMDGGNVAGIFSERDVVRCLRRDGETCLDGPVGEVMTAPAITVSPDTKIDEALGLMTRRRIRHLPVLDNGEMTAFVSIGDLVKHRIDQVENEAAAMRQYITAG